MMPLINPRTGNAINADSKALFRSCILDGWLPVGPNGQLAAKQVWKEHNDAIIKANQ